MTVKISALYDVSLIDFFQFSRVNLELTTWDLALCVTHLTVKCSIIDLIKHVLTVIIGGSITNCLLAKSIKILVVK